MFYVIPEQNGSTLVCQWRQTSEVQILNWLGYMDVGDEIFWWQFWDLGDKFDYLLSISFESQHLKDFWFKRTARNDRCELVRKFKKKILLLVRTGSKFSFFASWSGPKIFACTDLDFRFFLSVSRFLEFFWSWTNVSVRGSWISKIWVPSSAF